MALRVRPLFGVAVALPWRCCGVVSTTSSPPPISLSVLLLVFVLRLSVRLLLTPWGVMWVGGSFWERFWASLTNEYCRGDLPGAWIGKKS